MRLYNSRILNPFYSIFLLHLYVIEFVNSHQEVLFDLSKATPATRWDSLALKHDRDDVVSLLNTSARRRLLLRRLLPIF
ncbi:hypothetical protein B9Z55_004512 [Caenorhabditis nigoni]|uniref:Uncharacterized protein n=1 Tax=Caenorhabditis nigoni TaxID=1611254 RepID=A0A2G5UWR7_9PELO|nr:hypothetical protein B9Z55_004512 [Caenorhabditis nigoni]